MSSTAVSDRSNLQNHQDSANTRSVPASSAMAVSTDTRHTDTASPIDLPSISRPIVEKALIQFIKNLPLYQSEKPFQLFIDIPTSAPDQRKTNIEFSTHEVEIHDIRGQEEDFSLEKQGFQVGRLERWKEFEERIDSSKEASGKTVDIRESYLSALEELLRIEVEGVDRVAIFDWRRRSSDSGKDRDVIDLNDLDSYLKPANMAHVDQAPSAVLNRVMKTFPSEEQAVLLESRIRLINIWRPFKSPVYDWPLAICDGRTVPAENLVEVDMVRRSYVGSNMFVLFGERCRWYYLREQRPDEVLLFKQFDSNDDAGVRCCPHAAFQHSQISKNIPPRESIEVRALVFTYPEVRDDTIEQT
ncbi:hypothetical protein MMC25_004155 [Agyrium rufum]|nr:hypothetical protein [Agyrium rufum]